MRTNIIATLPTVLDRILRIPEKPMNIILNLEEACNLRCIQCDIWKSQITKPKLTLETRKEILMKIKNWLGPYILNIFAGEPLIHPQIFDLISFASKNRIKTIITTNGTLLSEQICKKLIDSQLSAMFISIDGYRDKTHDYIRGRKGARKMLINGLSTMIKLRGKKKTPMIAIESLITKYNFGELPQLVNMITEFEIEGIVFQPVTSKYGFGNSEYNPDWHNEENSLLPNYSKVKPVIEKLINSKRNGVLILNTFEHLKRSLKYFESPENFTALTSCLAHNNFSISVDGSISTCFPQGFIGDSKAKDFSKIWFGWKNRKSRLTNLYCEKTSKILLCNSLSLAEILGFE
ncbi:MAG: glycosyl transferase family 2 [uncultured bacterium]|nr:MAG: glycosyl transferase family 2 [uncultured bacterium]